MIPDIELRKLNSDLHESDQPLWRRIRHLLYERNIDPRASVLAYFAQEAPYYDFGVIVTDRDEVFQFAYDYLNKDVGQGRFAEWNNVTDELKTKPYRNQVSLAFGFKERRTG